MKQDYTVVVTYHREIHGHKEHRHAVSACKNVQEAIDRVKRIGIILDYPLPKSIVARKPTAQDREDLSFGDVT